MIFNSDIPSPFLNPFLPAAAATAPPVTLSRVQPSVRSPVIENLSGQRRRKKDQENNLKKKQPLRTRRSISSGIVLAGRLQTLCDESLLESFGCSSFFWLLPDRYPSGGDVEREILSQQRQQKKVNFVIVAFWAIIGITQIHSFFSVSDGKKGQNLLKILKKEPVLCSGG